MPLPRKTHPPEARIWKDSGRRPAHCDQLRSWLLFSGRVTILPVIVIEKQERVVPKAWDTREKELIAQALLDHGRSLFEKYGLQKTTVDEIASGAGISKGAFYAFHRSKEELYFAILESMEGELRERVYGHLAHPGSSRRESFKKFLEASVRQLIEVPLYGRIASEDLQLLTRKLPSGLLERHLRADQEYLAVYLGEWIERGWMRDIGIAAVTGLIRSLVYFVIHRDEIGEEEFRTISGHLIEMMVEYLIPGD